LRLSGKSAIGKQTFTGRRSYLYRLPMLKVVIIGNAGGGKSTLGRRLSARHGLPFFSVDQVQWLPGWTSAPEQQVETKLDELAAGERWIIDGWGPWPSIERRLVAADSIILVDLPLWMHFWLAAERQIAVARCADRSDPIEGCDQLEVTRPLFEMIWRVDRDLKPRLQELIDKYKAGKEFHHLTSLDALDAFGNGQGEEVD
jgi:adenylate kinase family enzyme